MERYEVRFPGHEDLLGLRPEEVQGSPMREDEQGRYGGNERALLKSFHIFFLQLDPHAIFAIKGGVWGRLERREDN